MAIQLITHKTITKFDERDCNFKKSKKPEKVVNGNVVEEDIYGEKKHTYQPDNGNLQMNEMVTGIFNKLDGLTNLNPNIVEKNRAVEVDIKREKAIGKADMSSIKSEEIKGKVNNKLDKLKALRNRKR